MRLLAVIPARGGSKGVPRKNVHPLAGRPLIAYTIDAALAASSVDRVVVSTEDDEIARISKALGAEVHRRPAELAGDDTPSHPVIVDAVSAQEKSGYRPDAVATLQPTSPLRTAQHIDEAAALFAATPEADSLVSCIEVPHIFHPGSLMCLNESGHLEPFLSEPAPLRRQQKERLVARNGAAIYLTRSNRIRDFIFGGILIPYFMDADASVDIDAPEDLVCAERLLAERGQPASR